MLADLTDDRIFTLLSGLFLKWRQDYKSCALPLDHTSRLCTLLYIGAKKKNLKKKLK